MNRQRDAVIRLRFGVFGGDDYGGGYFVVVVEVEELDAGGGAAGGADGFGVDADDLAELGDERPLAGEGPMPPGKSPRGAKAKGNADPSATLRFDQDRAYGVGRESQGLKPGSGVERDAKAEALAYLEATAKALEATAKARSRFFPFNLAQGQDDDGWVE
jgi:hypothetical protein